MATAPEQRVVCPLQRAGLLPLSPTMMRRYGEHGRAPTATHEHFQRLFGGLADAKREPNHVALQLRHLGLQLSRKRPLYTSAGCTVLSTSASLACALRAARPWRLQPPIKPANTRTRPASNTTLPATKWPKRLHVPLADVRAAAR